MAGSKQRTCLNNKGTVEFVDRRDENSCERRERGLLSRREQSPEEKGEALKAWLFCVLVTTSLFPIQRRQESL